MDIIYVFFYKDRQFLRIIEATKAKDKYSLKEGKDD